MSGFPILAAPTPRLSVPSRQYYRSASGSPTRQHFQQHVDDLISQLTPATAVSALRFPTGPLKACLDTATATEQSFAMHAALAASSIQEWLDELTDWPWPAGGGSGGFEEPVHRGGKLFTSTSPASSPPISQSSPITPERQVLRAANETSDVNIGRSWMGSLRAADVTLYGERITEIGHEIDDLEVEDMKQHVLHHHILPLSPPGTPSIGGQPHSSSVSTTTFTKLDDLSAVVTAIVLQTLPLLSKLVRLLDVWRIRLLVLNRIPSFLASLSAAEVAIQSAWNAVYPDSKDSRPSQLVNLVDGPTLTPQEFAIMKSVVEGKVSKAARTTDFMLDALDGLEDTIPEQWIDRIDAAERDYSEWVALCERKIREADWKTITAKRPTLLPPVPIDNAPPLAAGSTTPDDGAPNVRNVFPILPQTPPLALSARSSLESLRYEPQLPSFHLAKAHHDNDMELDSPTASVIHITSNALLPSDTDLASDAPVSRSYSDNAARDIPDLGEPSEIAETENLGDRQVSDASPSSSPPDFRASIRSTVTFNDMPTVAEIPGEESPTNPKMPVDSSFVFEDIVNDDSELPQGMPSYLESPGSPDSPASVSSRRMSVSSEDDQLQQQISEILESIPAKIHLSSQPSPSFSHLNPPDFKLPRKPKAPADNARSLSSMSSRSLTPSFLLAPAYSRNPRPRQQKGNQEIKLYHLSRSTGEAPIKLFIRLVGDNGERVMVRVGGGWADLTEYLKEYASHHSRRSKNGGESKIEIRDLPLSSSVAASLNSRVGSSPPSRPGSALDSPAAMAPLNIRKTRRATPTSMGDESIASIKNESGVPTRNPRTPLASMSKPSNATPPSDASSRSRSSSRLSWTEEDSSLGMSGPRAKNIEMSEESKAWVESVKERVRIASGERRISDQLEGKFGEIGKVGGTKRLFRKGPTGKGFSDKS
ncbi:gas2 domain containing protein [Sporothrix brasiliensis 5110]|uniref:Gas2 domain containing protein n=1 Tax=Sporothrix brasiliensis 5110 TaxID=1398154 RepID=A0A0C2IQK2_9PEZI|nr:gas2 domain containing protein [Sporothrix brasiliensis 5110]KIH89160.1 gas2 domain containing protein [Sporothrix brasiliensis 5110]